MKSNTVDVSVNSELQAPADTHAVEQLFFRYCQRVRDEKESLNTMKMK